MSVNSPADPVLRRVIYLSRSRRQYRGNELLGLCARFAASNVSNGITGVLVQTGDHFVQILEGAPHALMMLLRAIERDPRHTDFRYLLDEPIERRLFGAWSMGMLRVGEAYALTAADVQQVRQYVSQQLCNSTTPRIGVEQFIRSLPQMLNQFRIEGEGANRAIG